MSSVVEDCAGLIRVPRTGGKHTEAFHGFMSFQSEGRGRRQEHHRRQPRPPVTAGRCSTTEMIRNGEFPEDARSPSTRHGSAIWGRPGQRPLPFHIVQGPRRFDGNSSARCECARHTTVQVDTRVGSEIEAGLTTARPTGSRARADALRVVSTSPR